MVRTSSAGVKISSGKSTRKSGGGGNSGSSSATSPSTTSGKSSGKSSNRLPSIPHTECPSWQKPITNFFTGPSSKDAKKEEAKETATGLSDTVYNEDDASNKSSHSKTEVENEQSNENKRDRKNIKDKNRIYEETDERGATSSDDHEAKTSGNADVIADESDQHETNENVSKKNNIDRTDSERGPKTCEKSETNNRGQDNDNVEGIQAQKKVEQENFEHVVKGQNSKVKDSCDTSVNEDKNEPTKKLEENNMDQEIEGDGKENGKSEVDKKNKIEIEHSEPDAKRIKLDKE